MTFSLYTVASGGTALWTEPQNVIVSGGIYSVILGSVSTLTPLAFDVPYWLGVRVGSDAEMTPVSSSPVLGMHSPQIWQWTSFVPAV